MATTNEETALTEVPEELERLVRMVVRGFFEPIHIVVVDCLVRDKCVNEERISEVLGLYDDRKQVGNALDMLLKQKMVAKREIEEYEEDVSHLREEERAAVKRTKVPYYFIDYEQMFNTIKYRLHQMRHKVEGEAQKATTTNTKRCLSCNAQFSDLDVPQMMSSDGTLRCIEVGCGGEVDDDQLAIRLVEEGSSAKLQRLNEQLESVEKLMQQCDSKILSHSILLPEPTRRSRKGKIAVPRPSNRKVEDYSFSTKQTIEVSVGATKTRKKATREDMPWLQGSTVAPPTASQAGTTQEVVSNATDPAVQKERMEEIQQMMAQAEPAAEQPSAPMDVSDDEEATVLVQGRKVLLSEITVEHTSQMSTEEKAQYEQLLSQTYDDYD